MYATVPIAMPGVVKASGSKEPLGVSCGDTPSPGPLRSPGAWTRGSPALSHVEGHPLPQGGEGCWLGKVSPNRNQNLASSRIVTKMFVGLMSRCAIPLECAASSASAI